MGVIRMKLRTISGRFSFSSGKAQKDDVPARSDAAYIFVHGLSGWGSYDKAYKRMPYWGMFGGDLMQYLRRQGFACYAASVSPEGSAWDRACELCAQLTGTVTDYGKAHSLRWRENDGLVNTVSAMAPLGAPSKAFDPDAVTPGIWQILPTYPGDHMSLQGGMLKRNNIRPFYLELLEMIDALAEG